MTESDTTGKKKDSTQAGMITYRMDSNDKSIHKDCFTWGRFRKPVVLLFFLALAMITGCATAPVEEGPVWDPFKLAWPLPPDKPRIQYVDTLRGEADVATTSGFAASLFGEEGGEKNMIKPFGVVTDENGRVYVSDVGRVFVFDKENKKLSFIGDKGAAKLVRPLGMFYDRKNRLLYVADSSMQRVFVYQPDGRAVLEIGAKGELKNPGGIAVDGERSLVYVTNTRNHVVSVFDPMGNFIKNIGERGKEDGKFNYPTQIAIDKSGNIFVVDSGNFRIQVFDPEGKYVRKIGSVGTALGQFARPKGISIAEDGLIYVTDSVFNGVTTYDNNGTLLLTWGSRGFDKGLFELIADIHVDEKDRIYVVSQWTAKVDIFQHITYPDDTPAGGKAPEEKPSEPEKK